MSAMQTCFRCEGEGVIFPLEDRIGDPTVCPGCSGKKMIPKSYIKCIKCNATGKCYPFEQNSGQPFECPLCHNQGFTKETFNQCISCKGEGKIYPFEGKMGNPKTCETCKGIGFLPLEIFQQKFKGAILYDGNIDRRRTFEQHSNNQLLTPDPIQYSKTNKNFQQNQLLQFPTCVSVENPQYSRRGNLYDQFNKPNISNDGGYQFGSALQNPPQQVQMSVAPPANFSQYNQPTQMNQISNQPQPQNNYYPMFVQNFSQNPRAFQTNFGMNGAFAPNTGYQ